MISRQPYEAGQGLAVSWPGRCPPETLLIFMVKMERTDVAQEEADAIASLLQSNGYDARSVMTDVVQRLEEMDMADEKVGE